MKRWLLVLSIVFLAGPLFAFRDGKGKFELAYEIMGYTYREPHIETPIRLKAHAKHGASLKYTAWGAGYGISDTFSAIELRYITGKTDYNGYLWNGTPSKEEDLTDWYAEGRLLVGQHWYWGNRWMLSPYLGIGYRFLSNHADEMSSGGYRRESNYLYVPLGVVLQMKAGNFSVSLTGEADGLIKGSQKTCLSDVGNIDPPYGDYWLKDVRNEQDKGFGLRAGLKLEQNFGSFGIFVEPFYRFWKIQNSEVKPITITNGTNEYVTGQGVVEPFNITREYGVKVGISF